MEPAKIRAHWDESVPSSKMWAENIYILFFFILALESKVFAGDYQNESKRFFKKQCQKLIKEGFEKKSGQR